MTGNSSISLEVDVSSTPIFLEDDFNVCQPITQTLTSCAKYNLMLQLPSHPATAQKNLWSIWNL